MMKSLSVKIFAGIPTRKISKLCRSHVFMNLRCRHFSENAIDSGSFHTHFKATGRPHPLGVKTTLGTAQLGDHTGLQQNHIWTQEELEIKMQEHPRHQPKTISDHIMNKVMYGFYHSFNFITGYNAANPSVKAIEWRLIVLESLAGVPGFVAAGFRHFRSLRALKRDHGWI
eukprot:gene10496-14098_t